MNANLAKRFKAVHNRRNIEKHQCNNAVNIFDILKIYVKNRQYKADACAEYAKKYNRHKRKKNIPRKMQIGICVRILIFDKEISHNKNQNKQRNKKRYKRRKNV